MTSAAAQIGLRFEGPSPEVPAADLILHGCDEEDTAPPSQKASGREHGGPGQQRLFTEDPWAEARRKKKPRAVSQPTARLDPVALWMVVERECPEGRTKEGHAGKLHVLGWADRVWESGPWKGLPYRLLEGVLCLNWRPLVAGERASEAWIEATAGAWMVVPGARAALYPPTSFMTFEMK